MLLRLFFPGIKKIKSILIASSISPLKSKAVIKTDVSEFPKKELSGSKKYCAIEIGIIAPNPARMPANTDFLDNSFIRRLAIKIITIKGIKQSAIDINKCMMTF